MKFQNSDKNSSGNGAVNEGGVREINIRDIYATLVRGKWIIFIVSLLIFNIFLFKTLIEEPVYVAKTTVFVGGGGNQSMPFGFMGDGRRNLVNEMERLKSRNLAREVAQVLMDHIYLDEDSTQIIPILANYDEGGNFISFASLDAIAGRLQRAISFAQIANSDIIEVNARRTNPREAAVIANAYAQTYHDRNFQGSRAHSRHVREFLESQMRRSERELQEAEERLRSYQEQHGVVIPDAESRRVIDQVARLEAQKEELAVQIDARMNTLQSLQNQLVEQEPDVARGLTSSDMAYIRRIQEQMADLEYQRDLAISQNPQTVGEQRYQSRIRGIDEQLDNLRQTLQKRTNEFVRSLSPGDEGYLRQLKQRIATEQIELQGLRIQKNAKERSLQEYEHQFNQLPAMNMQYARLERAKRSYEQLYLKIQEEYNAAMIAEQSEFGSVNIIDDALVPNSPVSPNLQLNLIIGLFLGLVFGVGFVFLKEALSTRIRTPEDIKKENLVNLTTVANMYGEVNRISSKGYVSLKGRVINGYIITITNPLSPVSESIRALRTNLQYSQVDKPVKTLVVSSPNPGEGKSTIAANLAVSYAHGEKKVLIVDTDLRKPTLHNILDLNRKPGLTNILFENLDLSQGIQNTVVDNLFAISCGDTPANPADLLGSEKMKKLLTTLQKQFDMIIFDTPPVLAATDASVLGTICDGVVIVTASRRTKLEELKVSVESIENVHGRVFGTVLNKFDQRDSYGSAYTMQYYKYGSYGQAANGSKKKSVFSK